MFCLYSLFHNYYVRHHLFCKWKNEAHEVAFFPFTSKECTTFPIHSSAYNYLSDEPSSPLKLLLLRLQMALQVLNPGDIFQGSTQWLFCTPPWWFPHSSPFLGLQFVPGLPLWPIFSSLYLHFFFLVPVLLCRSSPGTHLYISLIYIVSLHVLTHFLVSATAGTLKVGEMVPYPWHP